ncbi:MAG: HAMP domain-containing histidine kinase [Flavobacteriaceae bacterium]|jgi:two-component system, sporulation sensor kinase D|nr:HAMP domain-containing histidine kinase [Flavobacteriaceae bacterium]MBT4113954.1 HAMP domain-containing histidine kinase [Flavobacteriaceae bacterium]MBT4613846.1 HAMP domain-containing histidine kinase [Flavobacteriaceae bacterium]MBT5246413.1 HAMP domain-containing histidine kinase [Flavobacteriaceae bacterium]MBT5650758.1 HAMP domain-containing histidine kinase [Flavobacteriaceae bacterium]
MNNNINIIRWSIILGSFLIISSILWNTYLFFQYFKNEEKIKMEIWSKAQIELINSDQENVSSLTLDVLKLNTSTPMILVNNDGSKQKSNIENLNLTDTITVSKLIKKFSKENKPIEIKYNNQVLSVLHYGNSTVINKLKYYPLALLLIVFLFTSVVYFFYKSSKTAALNKLWSGMAKETAHQIATPLSSIMGWIEILKNKNVDNTYIDEIQKDIKRLNTITDRFSKIGSVPTLERKDIVFETESTVEYMKTRSSNSVNFKLVKPKHKIITLLNSQLYSWTIENLLKNSLDSMKGLGDITIEINETNLLVDILIIDTGSGIEKKLYKKIFDPGYTSKKRGWGLGLSLSKRIIEDYHKGSIEVVSSTIGKGTTIKIQLKRAIS